MGTFLRGAILSLCLTSTAWSEEPIALPPVDVPISPEQQPAPESPVRRDVSGASSVIPVAERKGEAKDASELLQTSVGTVVSDTGGLGQSKSLSVRGASASGVLVMLDGTPLSDGGGGADLSTIPLAIVERFEVLRGGGSRYGSGALGGVVNVVTRAPAETTSASAELTVGSFNTQSANVSASRQLLGGAGLLVLHGFRTTGDFDYAFDPQPNLDGNELVTRKRENNQAVSGGALARYKLRAFGWNTDSLVELFALDRGLAGTAQYPTPDAHENSQRLSATVRASRPMGETWLLSTRTFALLDRIDLTGAAFGGVSAQLHSLYGTEAVADAFLGSHHGLSFTASAAGEGLDGSDAKTHVSGARLSAMAVDDLTFLDGDLIISPSVRVDRNSGSAIVAGEDGVRHAAGPFTTFSPKLGGLVALPKGFELRANAGQSSRAPSFLELYVKEGTLLPNPELRPERALFADGQLAHHTKWSQASVGGFYSLYEDLIAYELYPPMNAKPFNFRAARVYGLEAETDLRPHRLVSLSAGYTLMYSQNLRDDQRYYLKSLPYRPRHKVSARISAGPEVCRGRIELQAQSEQFLNRTETLTLPARAFVNVGVSSQVHHSPDVTVSGELKNVFDQQAADLNGYPLPGRAAYITLSVALDGRENGKGQKQ